MCFPGTSGLSAHPDLKYSWEWGQPQGTQAATAPYCSHATRWTWGWQFREHWTMTGPLPHPAEPEFALLSDSVDSEPSLSPGCPFSCCFQGCVGSWLLKGGPNSVRPAVLGPSPQPRASGLSLKQSRSRGRGAPRPAQHLPGVRAGELLVPC